MDRSCSGSPCAVEEHSAVRGKDHDRNAHRGGDSRPTQSSRHLCRWLVQPAAPESVEAAEVDEGAEVEGEEQLTPAGVVLESICQQAGGLWEAATIPRGVTKTGYHNHTVQRLRVKMSCGAGRGTGSGTPLGRGSIFWLSDGLGKCTRVGLVFLTTGFTGNGHRPRKHDKRRAMWGESGCVQDRRGSTSLLDSRRQEAWGCSLLFANADGATAIPTRAII